jgi:hypothetical protein
MKSLSLKTLKLCLFLLENLTRKSNLKNDDDDDDDETPKTILDFFGKENSCSKEQLQK